MSTCSDVATTEQLCYIPCHFCNIVLAVSVPCSRLFEIVTVRCGHCTNLWSVNMADALKSLSWQNSQSVGERAKTIGRSHPDCGISIENDMVDRKTKGTIALSFKFLPHKSSSLNNSFVLRKRSNFQAPNNASTEHRVDFGSSSKSTNKTAIRPHMASSSDQRNVNRPPEKRQRVPSAYNQFIKEEIQRIKANNPEISHREAFSTAAKNWAHFPHIHFGLMLETSKLNDRQQVSEKHVRHRASVLNK